MESNVKLELTPAEVRAFRMPKGCSARVLDSFGVGIDDHAFIDGNAARAFAMDSLSGTQTSPSVMTPVQFLQYFLPESIEVVTAKRTIDELIGRDIVASWEDEQVVTTVVEHTGSARPYGDTTTTSLSNINLNFEPRTIVRYEEGFEINLLEEARASKVKINAAAEKRKALSESLAIELNNVGFNGYNGGNNRTYGFLNDPNLPAYVSVATGASTSTQWSNKTFLEICADIRTAMQALRTRSGNRLNPQADETTLAMSSNRYEYLSTVTELGVSVMQWLKGTYPKLRIIPAIELDEANGGANVFYLFADKFNGKKVFRQNVVQTLRLLGVARREKGYTEAYTNATAGVMLNYPVGVVRYTGI